MGPARSATGIALLLANPHLRLVPPHMLFEVHLTGPGWSATGATFVGVPVLSFGINEHLGWTHTANPYHDRADLFHVEREGESYRFGDELRPFERHEEQILVRREDGTMRQQLRTVGETPQFTPQRSASIRTAGVPKTARRQQPNSPTLPIADCEEAGAMPRPFGRSAAIPPSPAGCRTAGRNDSPGRSQKPQKTK